MEAVKNSQNDETKKLKVMEGLAYATETDLFPEEVGYFMLMLVVLSSWIIHKIYLFLIYTFWFLL